VTGTRAAVARLARRLTGRIPRRTRTLRVVERGPIGGVLAPAERPGGPLIGWAELHDVVMNDTSLVIRGGALIHPAGVEQQLEAGLRIKGPGIVAHAGQRVVVHPSRPVATIPDGIRLCGFGSSNWYHWLVELLPTVTLLDGLPQGLRDLPLLVPEAVLRHAPSRDALELLAPGHPTVAVPRSAMARVGRVVWLDATVQGPRSLRDDALPRRDTISVHLGVLREFRAQVRSLLSLPEGTPARRRVLLVRPAGAKRTTDQAAIIDVGRRHDLEPVDLGTLTFAEQVQLFAEASVVVGPWGAAWASMVFANPASQGLMWAPEFYRQWPLYAQLAPVSGMSLSTLCVPTGATTFKQANTSPLALDPDVLDAALTSLG
jgi:capsular polysaccharide biosynthesis protein